MKHHHNVREYSNGQVTLIWDKTKCIHDGICIQNLSTVFQEDAEPNMLGAPTKKIIETVAKCTSGALKVKIGSHEWI